MWVHVSKDNAIYAIHFNTNVCTKHVKTIWKYFYHACDSCDHGIIEKLFIVLLIMPCSYER